MHYLWLRKNQYLCEFTLDYYIAIPTIFADSSATKAAKWGCFAALTLLSKLSLTTIILNILQLRR